MFASKDLYSWGGTRQVGGTLVLPSLCVCVYVCVVYGSVTLGTWGEVEHTQLRVSPD